MKIAFLAKRWHLILPLIAYATLAFREISLPGLYMDSVNPDYQAAWFLRGMNNIPAWIFPDNFFAGQYRLPLLNSLYGGNITAYFALLFFKITGFGLAEVRCFHALLGISVMVSLAWCLHQWKVSPIAIASALCLLAIDPTFLFAWRTQYYLQLVPVVFMAMGLGVLGRRHCELQEPITTRWPFFIAGILLGFAAYSYFIFAFYAMAIIIFYLLVICKKRPIHNVAIPLICGAMLGWLPFLYAHASIIANTSFQSYLDQLRGLQTAYGVVDQSQGGLVDRIRIVWERIGYLFAGNSLQTSIFGDWKGGVSAAAVSAAILAMGPLFCLLHFVNRYVRARKTTSLGNTFPLDALTKLLTAILGAHVIIGLIVGRPLGLQHYVMLLPVLYAMSAVGFTYLLLSASSMRHMQGLTVGAVLVLYTSMFAFNFSLSLGVSERLKLTGGEGMYSDAINVAVAHLETMPPDTVLLFPQWGYWMGAITIIGPRFTVHQTPTLAKMQERLAVDSDLLSRESFMLALGKEFLTDDTSLAKQKIEDFARIGQLHIEDITRCRGRNGKDEIWLVQLKRLIPQGAHEARKS